MPCPSGGAPLPGRGREGKRFTLIALGLFLGLSDLLLIALVAIALVRFGARLPTMGKARAPRLAPRRRPAGPFVAQSL